MKSPWLATLKDEGHQQLCPQLEASWFLVLLTLVLLPTFIPLGTTTRFPGLLFLLL